MVHRGNGDVPKDRAQNPIVAEAMSNSGRLEHAHSLISDLEVRLVHVLQGSCPEAGVATNPASTSPLLEILEQQGRSLEGVIVRLQVLISRVDL